VRRPVSRLPHRARFIWLLGVVAMSAGACTGDDGPVLDTATVTQGEVVQTVAAAAELEPASRVTVSAPVAGEVAQLLVGDGDVVESGDPLVRLTSDSIDLQVAQAEAAVEAADALAAAAAGAGMDFSPVVGAFRSQLDAVFPPLLEALRGQLDLIDAAAEELAAAADLPAETDQGAVEDALADARERIDEAEQGYLDARGSLSSAQAQARDQAASASASQQAAAAAQREQAELALEAAQARGDELVVVAPAAGVVELARGGDPGQSNVPDLDALPGGADLDALLGGSATEGQASGPLAEGVAVGTGQPLLTVFDLSGFTARVAVDEIDVVEVAVDQPVVVLVDAFPDLELAGRVAHVALAPERQPAGGSIYPVTVALLRVPDDVHLRVGLTASAEIEVRRVDGDTVVPTSALLRRGGDEVVHVVRDGIAREVAVEVIAIGDETAAVEGDVSAGERVVTTGVELIEDGHTVEADSS